MSRFCLPANMVKVSILSVCLIAPASSIRCFLAGFAAMLAMKNLVPLYFEKYDELVRQHTANLTIAEISAAENVAKAPVANFLYTR